MSITDPRLGTFNPDGSVAAYPETDVQGRPFERPCTTQGIGEGYFVVLPLGTGYEAIVDELKALVAPKPVKKVKAADDAADA